VAKTFWRRGKTAALGQDVLSSVRPGQMMTKIVHDHLVQLMGGDVAGINIKGNPGIVLIAGLQGSGKTTFSGNWPFI
jgi:signal recognition particle subunit SRP54